MESLLPNAAWNGSLLLLPPLDGEGLLPLLVAPVGVSLEGGVAPRLFFGGRAGVLSSDATDVLNGSMLPKVSVLELCAVEN